VLASVPLGNAPLNDQFSEDAAKDVALQRRHAVDRVFRHRAPHTPLPTGGVAVGWRVAWSKGDSQLTFFLPEIMQRGMP